MAGVEETENSLKEDFEPKGALTFTLLFAAVLLIIWFGMYLLALSRGVVHG